MKPESEILFPPFRLDIANERLWRGSQGIILRPKTFAVLRYLVEHPGRLVSKEDLLRAVWPGTRVSEAGQRDYIRELRKALGDDAAAPRFIETVHGRGYRFIGQVVSRQLSDISKQQPAASPQLATGNWQLTTPLVGREVELQQLHSWLNKALSGERQIVFVTGEPGIGKTTLVEAFLEQVTAAGDVRVARGQCIEHYGAGEAYLPVLEALGRLCREPGGEQVITLLGRYAPTWLAQLPWLVSEANSKAPQFRIEDASQRRMLREMAEAVEALTAERGLVLVLEDLHWSDYSTLDLIAFLAQRREQARLLLVVTYRPADVLAKGHPLHAVKQELQIHKSCEELSPESLTESDVVEYLTMRLAVGACGHTPLQPLAQLLHRRTEGNPLFIVTVVDDLVARGILRQAEGQWTLKGALEDIAREVPDSLRQMIEQQLARLNIEEQRILEAASVAGVEFSAAAVAAGIGTEIVEVEERCSDLVRRGQSLRAKGTSEWPDGTVSARYEFIHALYQEVLYARLTAGKRVQLHQRIGEREEQGYGSRAGEIAAELAVHFEQGRDYGRAIQYLQQAGGNAARRSAFVEAINHLGKGLELLKALPDTPARTQQELTLHTLLGIRLAVTKGMGALEAEKSYSRALELCQQVGETSWLFPVLQGLWQCSIERREIQRAYALGERYLRMAQNVQDPTLLLKGHNELGIVLYHFGELIAARAHLEQAIALYDRQLPRYHPLLGSVTAHTAHCLFYLAFVLWLLGYPDQALKKSQEALALVQEEPFPFIQAWTSCFAAQVHWFRRELSAAKERVEASITLSINHGFEEFRAVGIGLRGCVLVAEGLVEEGIAQMHQGMIARQTTGTTIGWPNMLAQLTRAYGKDGRPEEGLSLLDEAITTADNTGQHVNDAVLHTFKGELTLQLKQVAGKFKASLNKPEGTDSQPFTPSSQVETEAEACFHKAIDIARHQSAKMLELRATMSLCRLWQQQGKQQEARQMLAEIYGWFTEGFDTADLKDAKVLLQELED